MPLREYFMGHVPLAEIGAILSDQEEANLVTGRRRDLETFCPLIRRLVHAELITAKEVRTDGLLLRYALREREQYRLGLPLTDGVFVPPMNDGFRLEILAIRNALEAVQGNLRLITDPAIPLDDLLTTTISAAEQRALRMAIYKRRGKQIEFPGFGQENVVDIPDVPKTLPIGTALRITAGIGEFFRGIVTLNNVRVLTAGIGEQVDPSICNNIPMTRDIFGPNSTYGELLLSAKDHACRVTLDVVVIRQWADAVPIAFHLVKAHDLYGPHPLETPVE